MNFGDKVREQIADNVYPIEKLATLGGVGMTIDDPSLYIRQYNSIASILNNNINSKKGYYRYESGKGFVKQFDYNWKTLVDTLSKENQTDSFGYYLVARASYYD